jgi:hypothetical protein
MDGRGALVHGVSVAVMAVMLLASTKAKADERRACVEAAERGQSLRDSGKYKQAREQLLTCVRDACPAVIRRDCGEWLSQMESLAPTIVLGAKAGSRDLVDVKVSIDGVVVTEKLDGHPLPTDLGSHVFRFEWSGQTKEEHVVISAGQKGRNIVASFDSPATAASAPAAATAASAPDGATAEKPSLLPAYVVGAVGIAGLTSFAIFAISGRSEFNDLERTCKPTCTSDQVSGVRAKYLIGDISLALGAVALGVSVYLFSRHPTADRVTTKTGLRSVEWSLAPTLGGAASSLRARF